MQRVPFIGRIRWLVEGVPAEKHCCRSEVGWKIKKTPNGLPRFVEQRAELFAKA
jgi:hypothetical protein